MAKYNRNETVEKTTLELLDVVCVGTISYNLDGGAKYDRADVVDKIIGGDIICIICMTHFMSFYMVWR